MENRAYGLIRDIVERLGGSMVYEREGYRYGAWIITIGEKNAIIEATGNRSFPQLDRLYVPSVANPMHWDDYEGKLVPNAETKLLSMLGITSRPHASQPSNDPPPKSLPAEEIDKVAELSSGQNGNSRGPTPEHILMNTRPKPFAARRIMQG